MKGSGLEAGTVRVVSGDRLVASGQLVDGRVRLAVATADLGVGTHTLQVVYDGSAGRAPSTTSVSLRVLRAGSSTNVRVVRTGDRAKARVRVTTDPAGQAPERVRATLVRNGKVLRAAWLEEDPHPAADFLLHVAWAQAHGIPTAVEHAP